MRNLLFLLALCAGSAGAVEIDAIADSKNIGWSAAAFDKDASGNIDVLLSGTMVFSFTPTAVILGSGVTLDAAGLSGTIAAARMPALTGDVTTTVGTVATTIAADSVALGTDTTGGYAASATEGGAATTATAAAANGNNCSAGSYPLGVDTSWAAESCTADDDTPDADGEVPDAITVSAGTVTNSDVTLKAGTAPTVDGRIEYDTTLEAIVLGDDGAATKTIYPGLRAASTSDGGPATTATALAANGANCSASSFPLGVDASGAVESCSTSISGNAATATALAANGANCSAGQYPLGVDASGAVESCTAVGSGDVVGPASATDNACVRFDGTTGKLVQDSSCTISDTGLITGVGLAAGSGSITGTGTANRIGTATTADANADSLLAASAAGKKPLVVQGAPSQTADILTVEKSDGADAFRVTTGDAYVGAAGNYLYVAQATTTRYGAGGLNTIYGQSAAIHISGASGQHVYLGKVSDTATGIKVDVDTGMLTAQKGLDIADAGTKPSCDSTKRGNVWFEEGGAGVADTFEVCRKDAADAYAWVALY